MIQVKKIKHNVAEHFDPNGNSLGFLNELEHLDLRIQIAEHNVAGYYVVIPDEFTEGENDVYKITPSGELEDWRDGFYSQAFELVRKYFKLQRK